MPDAALRGAGTHGNVLLITLDQLRADVLDGALSGVVALPALERLQREGTSFSNAFTASVPCGPSRASLLTGLYAFNHRAIRNGTPLAGHHATLGTEVRKLGREPLLFGYCDTTPDPTGRILADPDFATYEQPAPGFREIVELRFEAPFAWLSHLAARGYALPRPLPGRLFDLFRPVTPSGCLPAVDDPALYSAEDSDTAFLTDRTLEALDVRRDAPWFAHVTFIRPHPPLVAPAPYNRLVDPATVPPPVQAGSDHPFRTAWFSAPTHAGLFHGYGGNAAALSNETVAALRAVYLGLVAEVDRHLGRILDWLDKTDQASQTLVIVLADHGEMLGDQGYWGKDNVLCPAHRIPLVVRLPGGPPGRMAQAMVSTVDVAPTVLDWLGATPPPAMDGASLLPLVGGEAAPWRSAVLTEVDLSHPAQPTRFQRAFGLPETACNAAVLRERDRTLVHFNGGVPPMLFDRARDCEERINLASDPTFTGEVERLRSAMLDLRMTRGDRRLTGFSFGA